MAAAPLWIVLFAWLVVYPLVARPPGLLWSVHLAVVCGLGLATVPRLWRRRVVRLGLPGLAVSAALVSLVMALRYAPPGLPRGEMQWMALTGLAHAGFFLLALSWVPAAGSESGDTRRLLAVLLVSMVAVQAGQVLLGVQPSGSLGRPQGSLGNPNALGSVVGAVALALAGLGRLRPAMLWLAVPLAPLLLATRSRGAVLAVAVTLALLALRRRMTRLVVGLGLALVVLAVVPNPLRERVVNLDPEHAYSRAVLWGTAASAVADHPLGIGPRMYRYEFPRRAWNAERPWLLHQRHAVGLTHNVFLTLAVEWGWLAGASLVWLAAWSARRLLRGHPDDPLRTGAALGATVLFVDLQVDGLEQNPIAFTLFLLLLALALARVPEPSRGLALPGRALAVVLLGAVLSAAGLTGWRTVGLLSWHGAQRALQAFERGESSADAVRVALDEAERRLPGDAEPVAARLAFELTNLRRRLEGGTQQDAAATDEIAAGWAALERARAANPADHEIAELGGELASLVHRAYVTDLLWQQRAIDLRLEALALDPLDVQGHWALAQQARRLGREELAESAQAEALRLEPDYALAWYTLARLADADGDLPGALHAYVRAEEAVLNCHVKARRANPGVRAFYAENLEGTDLAVIRARLRSLRQELYF
jgi:tetratricopeptide (TPR) repeat protein/O-antigen ligase